MELRHLRYFVAIAEERSFSRAAARLNIAQPPLSQQIRRLERDLGYEVFERTPKGVILTRAGEVLLKHAYGVLDAAANAVSAASAASRGVAGRVTVAFMNSAAYSVVPRLLKAYRAAYPDIEVEIREMVIADQLDALVEKRIDVGILRPPVDDSRLTSLCLTRESFIVAVPHDHPLTQYAMLSLEDLADVRMVSYPRGHPAGFRERIELALRAAGVTPHVVHEATQIHTICGLVAGGVGAALVPDGACVLAIEGLTFVPLHGSDLHAETWLSWRVDASLKQILDFTNIASDMTKSNVST